MKRGASLRAAWLTAIALASLGLCGSANAQTGTEADALARQHWVLNCMGCHTATGGGIAGKVPALAESLGYFERVPGGREYVMRVPGASNSALSDEDLAGVLNWLLTDLNRNALPAGFQPYTADEVHAHRRPALSDVGSARAALLRSMHEQGITAVAEHY